MLPFDVDGKEPLHFNSAAADGGSEWFSLAVAEEKHLKDMGVVNRHTTSCHLPIAVLQSQRKKSKNLSQLLFSSFTKIFNVTKWNEKILR